MFDLFKNAWPFFIPLHGPWVFGADAHCNRRAAVVIHVHRDTGVGPTAGVPSTGYCIAVLVFCKNAPQLLKALHSS